MLHIIGRRTASFQRRLFGTAAGAPKRTLIQRMIYQWQHLGHTAAAATERTFIQRMIYRWHHLGEGYLPHGDLVYQGTKEGRMRWGHILTLVHAGGWTAGTVLQYLYPADGFSVREMVCFTGVAWLAFFVFNIHLRRTILQLWVQEKRWIHVITSNWFGTERGFKIPMGYCRMEKGRFATHKHQRYNYWLCEIHQKGRYFCIYKEKRGGKYVDPALFNHIFGHPCAEILHDSPFAHYEGEIEVIPKLENREQLTLQESVSTKPVDQSALVYKEEELPAEVVVKPDRETTKKTSTKPSHWKKKSTASDKKPSWLGDPDNEKRVKNKSRWTGEGSFRAGKPSQVKSRDGTAKAP